MNNYDPLLRNQSENSSLSLRSDQDIRDFVRKSVEDSKHWFATHTLNFAKSYIEGNIELVFKSCIRTDTGEYDLVFVAIEDEFREEGRVTNMNDADLSCSFAVQSHRAQDSMLICVTHILECPEKIIPSFVWLERNKTA